MYTNNPFTFMLCMTMIIVPLVVIFRAAYKAAQREDNAMRTIRTQADTIGFNENGYFPGISEMTASEYELFSKYGEWPFRSDAGLVPIINPMITEYVAVQHTRHTTINPMIQAYAQDNGFADPQPFNWDSNLHMMLPNEITTYIQEDK